MTAVFLCVGFCVFILLTEFILWKRFSACLKGIDLPFLGNSGLITKKRINVFCILHTIFLCVFICYMILAGW